MKFLKYFSSQNPTFLFDALICVINTRSQKLLEIFSALKCVYLELSTGKIRNLGFIFVNTPRVNFCISRVPDFTSSARRSNLKILKNPYHTVKLQEKWVHKNATAKKLFWFCYTLGCNICIKSEKITFVHILKFLKNFFFIVLHFLKNAFIFLINPRNTKLLEIFSAWKCA